MASIRIGDVFTKDDMNRAWDIFDEAEHDVLLDRLENEIVKPAMPKINKVTGQENDSRYMTYALLFAITSAVSRSEGQRPN